MDLQRSRGYQEPFITYSRSVEYQLDLKRRQVGSEITPLNNPELNVRYVLAISRMHWGEELRTGTSVSHIV